MEARHFGLPLAVPKDFSANTLGRQLVRQFGRKALAGGNDSFFNLVGNAPALPPLNTVRGPDLPSA